MLDMEINKREAATPSNLGPVVSVVTWIVEASVIIAVGIKFTLSSIIPRRRNREDVALSLATLFSLGFTISVSLAVPNGIGKHRGSLSLRELESLQKALYSADILLVLVSSCAQASVLLFLHGVTPDRVHRMMINVIAGYITLFSFASFVVTVFPCHPPHVWQFSGDGCIDRFSFWQAFAGVNIVIENTLVLLPAFVVYPLRMERRYKTILVSCFATRLIVVGSFAAQIYEARHLKRHLDDPTFHAWKYLLTTVLVQGLSVITVCIPYIRNLLLAVESGMIQTGRVRLASTETELRFYTISSET